MPEPNEGVVKLVNQQQAALLRQENALAKQIAEAYEAARLALLADFTERFQAMGENPEPAAIRQMATNLNLIRAIENRLALLGREMEGILTGGLQEVGQDGFEAARVQIDMMAAALGIELPRFAVDPNLELTIAPAIEQVPGLVSTMQSRVTATLRESLASGDRFSTISQTVYGKHQGIWPNGKSSAELMVRRAVIQVNNNARMLFYEQAKKSIPGLKKQAIAAIQPDRTTETCRRVHEQIKELDQPFETTGKEAFSRWQMQPPFHWICRTTVVAYHDAFTS